jgi:multicomponent Na+:H+ antiporter subunit E
MNTKSVADRAGKVAAGAIMSFLFYLLLAQPLDRDELVLGLAVAMVCGLLTAAYPPFDLRRVLNPLRWLRGLVYLPVFVVKMVQANLQIAAIVLRPKLKIHPAILRGKTRVVSPRGKLLLTSSITLTPGTLAVDVRDEQVYVHCVTTELAADGDVEAEILAPYEKHIRGISE